MRTLGIHVVWTSYLTWLPGDRREHWSPLFDFYGHLTAHGGKLQMPDETTVQVAARLANESAKYLDATEIGVVAGKIGELVAGSSGPNDKPHAFAAAIEPNHVHLLLGPVKEDIGKCVGRLKGTSSSAVLALPSNAGRKRTWTAGYWKVFLFDTTAVRAVKEYIDAHNLRRGLPAHPFPWITPIDGFI